MSVFDYWICHGLVKVVRVGETEEDDSLLFTATSTPDQWREQGDYFKKKGLWDPAVKCYRKAGLELLEKEAEAYAYAQRAKQACSAHEQQHLFDKAAECFLLCDHNQHDVTFLTNAARCLKNARKHSEAAKLFERLGEVNDMHTCAYIKYFLFQYQYMYFCVISCYYYHLHLQEIL